METKNPYLIVFRCDGKIISSVWGDYTCDEAALQRARHYLRSSPAEIAHIHRHADQFPLVGAVNKWEAA